MKAIFRTFGIMSLCLAILVPTAHAEGWGSLKGQFVYEGEVLKTKQVKVLPFGFGNPLPKGAKIPNDESLTVSKKGHLANVIVYLITQNGEVVPIHPDYEKCKNDDVILEMKDFRFNPHITLLRTKQKLIRKNSDAVANNIKIVLGVNESSHYIVPANEEIRDNADVVYDKPESVVCLVSSSIYPFMQGYILIRGNPYMTVSAKDGTFEIKNLPAGEHTFQLWHEIPGNLQELKIGEKSTDKRGRIAFTIEADKTLDLGTIKVPAKVTKY